MSSTTTTAARLQAAESKAHEIDTALNGQRERLANSEAALQAMKPSEYGGNRKLYGADRIELEFTVAEAKEKIEKLLKDAAEAADELEEARRAHVAASAPALLARVVEATARYAALVQAQAADAAVVLADVETARSELEANTAELRRRGLPVGGFERRTLPADWPSIVHDKRGPARVFLVGAETLRWLDPAAVARREHEEREFLRQREIEREVAARNGWRGPEERERQIEKDRAGLRAAYPGPNVFTRETLATLDEEVRSYRENAGLQSRRGED